MERLASPGENEALGLLGLARRAGAVSRGVDATRRALVAGEVRLVLLASDASDTQLKKVYNLIHRRLVPVRWVSAKDVLGQALGSGALSIVGVTAGSFATQMLQQLPPVPSASAKRLGLEYEQEEPGLDAGR